MTAILDGATPTLFQPVSGMRLLFSPLQAPSQARPRRNVTPEQKHTLSLSAVLRSWAFLRSPALLRAAPLKRADEPPNAELWTRVRIGTPGQFRNFVEKLVDAGEPLR